MKTSPSEGLPLFPVGNFQDNFDSNPMVRQHGKGPERRFCKTCGHIRYVSPTGNRTYIKCYRRGISRGEGTDHRLKWNACRLYEREEG